MTCESTFDTDLLRAVMDRATKEVLAKDDRESNPIEELVKALEAAQKATDDVVASDLIGRWVGTDDPDKQVDVTSATEMALHQPGKAPLRCTYTVDVGTKPWGVDITMGSLRRTAFGIAQVVVDGKK
eukprot:gene401-573_t